MIVPPVMRDLIRHPVAKQFDKNNGFRIEPGMTETQLCAVSTIAAQSVYRECPENKESDYLRDHQYSQNLKPRFQYEKRGLKNTKPFSILYNQAKIRKMP